MRLFMIVLLLTAPTSWPQEPTPSPISPSTEVPQQAPQPAPVYSNDQPGLPRATNQLITLPAGTRIPLALTSSIGRKLSQPGDAVRAEIAFPVRIGNTVAIPLGTYVEGEIAAILRRNSSRQIGVEIHFTRLIFANGYEVAIPGATARAKADDCDEDSLSASSHASPSALRDFATIDFASLAPTSFLLAMFAEPQQLPPLPPLPPLPHRGPPAAFIAAAVIVAALAVITIIVLAHPHTRTDAILPPGAPIDLILDSPLTLDADNVAAAASISDR